MNPYKELYKELLIAVSLYKEAQEDTEMCTEIMLSSSSNSVEEASKLMGKMYKAREYMYSLMEK